MMYKVLIAAMVACGIGSVSPFPAVLNIAQKEVTIECVESGVAKLGGDKIMVINLAQSKLTDDGVKALIGFAGESLVINIAQSAVTDEQEESLREYFKDVNVAQCGSIPDGFVW